MRNSDVYDKCPNCGYEYEINYGHYMHDEVLKGDEPFIEIDCIGRPFETNKDISDDYEPREYMKVYLYGCPKCKMIHYKEV